MIELDKLSNETINLLDKNKALKPFILRLLVNDKIKDIKEDVYLTIPKKSVKDLKVYIKYNGPIIAPINKDQEIGTLIVESSDEDEAREIPVYAKEKVKKVNFLKSLFLSFNYMIWGDA